MREIEIMREKREKSQQIEKDVKAFRKNGGKIKRVNFGHSVTNKKWQAIWAGEAKAEFSIK